MPRLEFTEQEATSHKAIVVSFDLESFSDFCNQPDASIMAPKLVERVFDLLNQFLYEPDNSTFFPNAPEPGKLPVPRFNKFTGDGALMLWVIPNEEDFTQVFRNQAVETLRRFQQQLAAKLPGWEKEWGVHGLPKRARVGIAAGVVYALRPPHFFTGFTEPNDFVGYCINLAVRLQDYCRELGFLVHGDLHPELPGLVCHKTVEIDGCRSEPVAMFCEDIDRVTKAKFKLKFHPVGVG